MQNHPNLIMVKLQLKTLKNFLNIIIKNLIRFEIKNPNPR